MSSGHIGLIFGAAIGLMLDDGSSEEDVRECMDTAIAAYRQAQSNPPSPEAIRAVATLVAASANAKGPR